MLSQLKASSRPWINRLLSSPSSVRRAPRWTRQRVLRVSCLKLRQVVNCTWLPGDQHPGYIQVQRGRASCPTGDMHPRSRESYKWRDSQELSSIMRSLVATLPLEGLQGLLPCHSKRLRRDEPQRQPHPQGALPLYRVSSSAVYSPGSQPARPAPGNDMLITASATLEKLRLSLKCQHISAG